jgi:N-acetylglucosamine-6-phosphate deacetylase
MTPGASLLRLPGLVDLQVNGYGGVDFNGPGLGLADIEGAATDLRRDGVTAFLPTLVSAPSAFLLSRLSLLTGAAGRFARGEGASFPRMSLGVHLEGPFISAMAGARGAHDAAAVRDPDLGLAAELFAASGGSIRLLTLAPELPGAIALVEWCVERGIKVALGHTAADAAAVAKAVEAGAELSTHLGNGCQLLLPRHPNLLWDQLAEDRLWASVIADGHHLPPSFLKVVRKVKGERLMLVSDATRFTGMESGLYEASIGGRVLLGADRRLCVAASPELLGGAATPLLGGVLHLVSSGIAGFDEAWRAASAVPARFLGLDGPPGHVLFDAGTGRVEETTLA